MSTSPGHVREAGSVGGYWTAWLAWGLCLACISLGILGLLFGFLYGRWNYDSTLTLLARVLAYGTLAVSFPVVGALVATHRPRNPLGWIFCAIGLSQGLLTFAQQYGAYALRTAPATVPGGELAVWLAGWVWIPGIGLLSTCVPLLFPDGRLPSRRWRPVGWVSAVVILTLTGLGIALLWPLRGPALAGIGIHEVTGSLGAGSAVVLRGLVWLLLLCGVACVTALFVRFRRARQTERLQLKWFLFASTVTTASLIAIASQEGSPHHDSVLLVSLPALPSIPTAAGIAILHYRLYEIDRIINRALVYGALTALLATVYASLVLLPAQLFGGARAESNWVVGGATLAVAGLFQPARHRVQAAVDRRFNRRRYDAARIVDAFGIRLRAQVDLETISTELLDIIAETVEPGQVSLLLRPTTSQGTGRGFARRMTGPP